MRKKLIIGIVLLVLLLALGLLIALVNANAIIASYKPSLESTLSRALGAQVSLGELSVSLFPGPTVLASNSAVRGLNGAESGITVRTLRAHAALKPLLSKRLELSTVTIGKPVIRLQETAQGIAVKGLPPKAKEPAASQSISSAASGPETPTSSTPTISIERIVVEDGQVIIEDSNGAVVRSIQEINVDMGVRFAGDAVDVSKLLATFKAPHNIPFSIRSSDISFNTSSHAVSIPSAEISAPAGTMRVAAKTTGPKTGSISITADTLDLSKLAQMAGTPAGTIAGTITRVQTELTSVSFDDPRDTAMGTGTITVHNGVIKGLNIPAQALQKISSLPLIGGDIRARIPSEFEHIFAKADTTIQELSSNFSFAKGTIHISNLILGSDYFTLRGGGTYALRGEANLAVDLGLDPKVSAGITSRVKELTPLVDQQGHLVLPLTIAGRVPAVVVTPNLDAILKKASTAGVAQALDRVLKDKKIGGKLGKILGF